MQPQKTVLFRHSRERLKFKEDDKMSVSKQLIHLRNVKGISQEELASLMNVTR